MRSENGWVDGGSEKGGIRKKVGGFQEILGPETLLSLGPRAHAFWALFFGLEDPFRVLGPEGSVQKVLLKIS